VRALINRTIPGAGAAVTAIVLVLRICPVVFDSFFLLPALSAHSNLGAGAFRNKLPRAEIVERRSVCFASTPCAGAHLFAGTVSDIFPSAEIVQQILLFPLSTPFTPARLRA